MKVRRVIGVAAACCLLAGCFEADQDLTVEEDGSATFRTRIAMEASVVEMSEDDEDFCAPDEVAAVDGVSVEQESFAEGSMEVCTVTASGPIDRLAEWIELDQGPTGADGEMGEAPTITLRREDSNYVFSVHFESSPMETGADDPMMEEMKPMMVAAFAGRSLDWSVSAPEILETNGQLSEDGKTASYSVPMASLLDEGFKDRLFEVRFALDSPGLIKRLLGN